jgi:DNA-binding transcriptional LysR family regulator
MKISVHQIEAFTYAARTKSFSEAARELGVTQSAITQHIANLERLMGSQLFVRRREGLELTRPGTELYDLSDQLCTIEQLIGEKIEAYGALTTGHLDIFANAPRPAMPVIARYSELYPDVGITFALGSWTVGMSKLKHREIDIAVITEPDIRPGLYARQLTESKFVACMRTDHPLTTRKRLKLKDLKDQVVVLPERGSLTQKVVQKRLLECGLSFHRQVEMTTYPVVKEAILHGIGVGIMLDDSFHPSSSLEVRPIDELDDSFATYLVTPQEKSSLRFVRSFIDLAFEGDMSS